MDQPRDTSNPYAPPLIDQPLAELRPINPEDCIRFCGTVTQQTLREALTVRFSWSGLGLLLIVSLLGWVASPAGFFTPWAPNSGFLPRRIDPPDLSSELLGLMAVMFMLLGVWHLFATFTRRGLDRREAAVLEYAPDLYEAPTQGEVHEDHIYLLQPHGEAWFSWRCVMRVRFGPEVIIIDWANGVTGNTVLTQDMFGDVHQFLRVKQKLESINPAIAQADLANLPDLFSTESSVARFAERQQDVLAEINHRMTNREAQKQLIADIPAAIFQISWPLHAFFGAMLLAALVLTYNKLACVSIIAGIWAVIIGLAFVMALVQHRNLFFRPNDRLMVLRTRFTQDTIWYEATNAVSIVPVDSFQVESVEHDKVKFRVGNTEGAMERRLFSDDEQWATVVELISRNTNG